MGGPEVSSEGEKNTWKMGKNCKKTNLDKSPGTLLQSNITMKEVALRSCRITFIRGFQEKIGWASIWNGSEITSYASTYRVGS